MIDFLTAFADDTADNGAVADGTDDNAAVADSRTLDVYAGENVPGQFWKCYRSISPRRARMNKS